MIAGIGWIDWALLAVLALSVVVGLWRGFLFEVMSLLGWIVAWFVAQWFAVDLAPHMPIGAPGSTLQLAVSFVGVFVAALLVWGLLAHVVQMLLRATPLSAVDRLLGAGFGLLRGAVLLLAVAFVVALTPASKSTGWRASQGALWLNTAMHGLKPVLPDTVVRRLPA